MPNTSTSELQAILTPEIRQILLPAFSLIGSEGGPGCAARMRGYLRDGVHNSLGEIHGAVSARVLSDWEQFIQQACVHTEGFVRFIKEWLAGLQQFPVPQSDEALNNRRQHADGMTTCAEKLLKPQP